MIELRNLTTVQVEEGFVKKIVKEVLKKEQVAEEPEISVAFIGPGRMRKLNRTYRKKNRITDVLAFPESKVKFEKFKIGPTEETKGLGELVICLREVTKNARKFGFPFKEELAWVLVHGVLHLLGYEHEKSRKEAKKMKEREERYFADIKSELRIKN